MTRRSFLALAGACTTDRTLALSGLRPPKTVRLAVITDLHHGLAPDALERLQAFVEAVQKHRNCDAVLQLGDFCYSQPASSECLHLFATLKHQKVHVLGNHDMDKCDKETAMKAWGMESRYGSLVINGLRIVYLDLNHFKKDGELHSYQNGNYFTDGATHNWADPEQLEWLGRTLQTSAEPVLLLSHQPLGFAAKGQPLPPEQQEVLDVIRQARTKNPKGGVIASLFGHLHVDRLEHVDAMPCLCLNSASYFWYEGMRPYTKPLFAFLEIEPTGIMRVQGVSGEFKDPPPEKSSEVIGRSASIRDREVTLRSKSLARWLAF